MVPDDEWPRTKTRRPHPDAVAIVSLACQMAGDLTGGLSLNSVVRDRAAELIAAFGSMLSPFEHDLCRNLGIVWRPGSKITRRHALMIATIAIERGQK